MSIFKLSDHAMTGGPYFQRGESINTTWSVVVEVYGIAHDQRPKLLVVHVGPPKIGVKHKNECSTKDVFMEFSAGPF